MVIIRATSRLCYPHCIYLYIPRKSSKLMLCCFCYCSKGSLHTPLLCVVGKYVVHCIFLSDMQKLCPELLPIWFQLPSWLEVNKDKNFNPNLSQKCWKVLDSSSVSTPIYKMFQIKVSFLPCLPSDPPIFFFKFGVKDLTERQVHNILLVILAEITVQFTWDVVQRSDRGKSSNVKIFLTFLVKRTTSIIFWVVLFTIVSEKSCNLIPCIYVCSCVPSATHTLLDRRSPQMQDVYMYYFLTLHCLYQNPYTKRIGSHRKIHSLHTNFKRLFVNTQSLLS